MPCESLISKYEDMLEVETAAGQSAKDPWFRVDICQPEPETMCFVATVDSKGNKYVSIAEYSSGIRDNDKPGFYVESCGYDGTEYDMVEGGNALDACYVFH
jgi:hypothetical protein